MQIYWPSSLSAIKPINHRAYRPSSLSTLALLSRLLSLSACLDKIASLEEKSQDENQKTGEEKEKLWVITYLLFIIIYLFMYLFIVEMILWYVIYSYKLENLENIDSGDLVANLNLNLMECCNKASKIFVLWRFLAEDPFSSSSLVQLKLSKNLRSSKDFRLQILKIFGKKFPFVEEIL